MIALLIAFVAGPVAAALLLAALFPGPVAALVILAAIFGEAAPYVGVGILLLYFVWCLIDDAQRRRERII